MKNIFRYIIGLSIGALIMHLGRYKIHLPMLTATVGLILITIFDLLNQKSK